MIGSRFYGVSWFGTQTIASAIFGLPAGFLTIWIVSLLTAPPPKEVQDLVVSVRYPKSGQATRAIPSGGISPAPLTSRRSRVGQRAGMQRASPPVGIMRPWPSLTCRVRILHTINVVIPLVFFMAFVYLFSTSSSPASSRGRTARSSGSSPWSPGR